ncbi:MAG: right-handed parallel beta-helix repeat-containing protein [Bacillota bacterium]|nr:right-handed parallel beta-helix repeat-containing protein [Bacillota bacterium]MDW7728911.1 right-handed parallel beta-helix repeat-containing protein [Bacillota bacterium]
MVDCKSCNMSYDEKEFNVCPYCGEEPEVKTADKETAKDLPTVTEADKTEDKSAEGKPDKTKSAGGRLKFIIIGVVVLAVLGAIIFALFSFGGSSVTVPDKYATIQEAIDAAEEGDVIIVDVGVYRESIDFRGKNITLQSTDPDDPAIVSETIIDGGGSGTVVSFRSGETEEAVISGFTITRGSGVLVSGGSSPLIEKCIIEDNTAEFGAGIAVFDSSPTIRDNLITGNSGFLGGGLFIEESSPLVQDNTITGNRAEMGSGMVIISNSSPNVIDNVIADNTAARLGGGIVVAVNSTPVIRDNVITANRAERNGGGLLIEESEPVVENNNISRNRAANGGGIFIVNSLTANLIIKGNHVVDNLAYIAGGGLYMEGSSPLVEDNEFINNISEYLGGAAAVYNSSPIFIRNLFENNQAQDVSGGGAIWASADSNLVINDPDDNRYMQNMPDDLFQE